MKRNTKDIWYRIQDASHPMPDHCIGYADEEVPGIWVRSAAFKAVADILWGGDDNYSEWCHQPELWLLIGRELSEYETEAGFVLTDVEIVARLTPVEVEGKLRIELERRGLDIEDLEDCEDFEDWDEIAEEALNR